MKPDVIVCWPRNCDYPLWRQYIHDHREKFNLVIIVFTETHEGEDYRAFVKEAMRKDWVLTSDSPVVGSGEDWRNVAVNYGLLQSYNAEWIWFTEQDFIPNHGFWLKVYDAFNEGAEAIGVMEGDRLHPCSLLLKRKVLQATRKDFGIVVNKSDHFSKLTQDLGNQDVKVKLIDRANWTHMNGLSHNMALIARGEKPVYKPEEFNQYLNDCLNVSVPLDRRFNTLSREYLKRINFGVKPK